MFGVPDEITDVTRVFVMVQKRRLIYRMVSFGHRKDFGHYRQCTGSDEWVLGFHREGPTHPGVTNGFRVFIGRGPPTQE